MKRKSFPSTIFLFAACAFALFIGSCKKKTSVVVPPPPVPRLTTQEIRDNPSPLLQSLADSPVHWRQFTATTVQYAKESNKLLLLYISSSSQQQAMTVFQHIHSNPAIVQEINEQYVPVLIDADACREMGVLSAILCAEISKPLNFPMMVWATADGNPVTWLPLGGSNTSSEAVLSRLKQSQDIVTRMWSDESSYMLKNSSLDAASRRERLKGGIAKTMLAAEKQQLFTGVLRDLQALRDSLSGNIENMGTLFPSSMQEFYAITALSPNLPKLARDRSLESANQNARMFLQSAGIDFLDGGFYSSRRDRDWHNVNPDRNGTLQARAIYSFAQIAYAGKDPEILAAAELAMKFQETHFALEDQTFSLTAAITAMTKTALYWTTAELQSALNEPEYALLQSLCELSDTGNMPMESDTQREFFRLNHLTMHRSLAAAATLAKVNADDAPALLQSIRNKLTPLRAKKMPETPITRLANAQTTLLTASAYAALYTATAQESYQQKAVATMQAFRKVFHNGPILQYYPSCNYPATSDARAGLLAHAAQTALDLYDITLDPAWLDYTDQLCAAMVKDHLIDGEWEETPPSSRFLQIPLVDRSMIFDQSTSGMMTQNIARLTALDRKIDKTIIAPSQLPTIMLERQPVIHSDYILGLLYQDFFTTVTLPADASAEWRRTCTQLPTRLVSRKLGAAGTGIVISRAGQPDQTITDPSILTTLFHP